MISAKLLRRWICLAVSLFGIGYELACREEWRWPLLAGYTFVIVVTIYLLQAEKLEKKEESE